MPYGALAAAPFSLTLVFALILLIENALGLNTTNNASFTLFFRDAAAAA
jgi:hypothetical protein